jgi:hypothetical protein
MTTVSQFFLLLSAIYLVPDMPLKFRKFAGSLFLFIAIILQIFD